MNISKIKEKIENKKGETIHFRYNGARNQIEEFDGIIESTYKAIFTIRLKNEKNEIKTFTYSDVLTQNIELM